MDYGTLLKSSLLLPVSSPSTTDPSPTSCLNLAHEVVASSEDAPPHKGSLATNHNPRFELIIDAMKAATLGFVTPRMRMEYCVGSAEIAGV